MSAVKVVLLMEFLIVEKAIFVNEIVTGALVFRIEFYAWRSHFS